MRFAFPPRDLAPLAAVLGVIAINFATNLPALRRSQSALAEAAAVEKALAAQSDYLLLLIEAESRQRAYLLLDSEEVRREFEAHLAELRASRTQFLRALEESGIPAREGREFDAATEKRIRSLEEVVRLKRSGSQVEDILAGLRHGVAEMTLVKRLGAQTRGELSERIRMGRLANHFAIRNLFLLNAVFGVVILALTVVSLLRLNNSFLVNREMLRTIAAEKDRYRTLAKRLDTAREAERAEVARNIHDDFGQRLTAIKMDLSMALRKLNPADAAAKEQIDSAMQMADEAIRTVRGLATELRPALLDQLGLAAALKWQLEEFSRRTAISTTSDIPPDFPQVSGRAATVIYRIVQEALTNAARHSGASGILVSLGLDGGELQTVVEDNGRGFDPGEARTRSVGLLAMEERAILANGSVEFLSRPGAGVKVVVRLPFPEKNPELAARG